MKIRFLRHHARWESGKEYDIPTGVACVFIDRKIAVRATDERETQSQAHTAKKRGRPRKAQP